MMDFFTPIREQLTEFKDQTNEMQKENEVLSNKLAKNTDEIREIRSNIDRNEKDVTLLKRTIYNQQVFIEGVQKRELRNNLIILGIPNDDLTYDGTVYQSSDEKVAVVLTELCPNIDTSAYNLTAFPPAEGRTTHVCKIAFNDYDTKMEVSSNCRKLKEKAALSSIFIKWDEPCFTRLENSRLRKKRYDLLQDNPDDEVKISKGILYHNNVECDNFINQIF